MSLAIEDRWCLCCLRLSSSVGAPLFFWTLASGFARDPAAAELCLPAAAGFPAANYGFTRRPEMVVSQLVPATGVPFPVPTKMLVPPLA
jgi:hypothetical protein